MPPRRPLRFASPLAPALAPLLTLMVAGCSSDEPLAYADIASSAQLAPNADPTGRTPFRYATEVNWRDYDKVIIEPVVIYTGRDQQFGEMSQADRETLARHMQQQFTQRLSRRFTVVQHAGPKTLRVKLTLTGATANTPGLATLSRFDVAGAVVNGVQTIRDGEGTFTGSVRYVVEIQDAKTGRLLTAFVSKQYPKPYDIQAGIGPLDAAKTGIDRGSDELLAQLK